MSAGWGGHLQYPGPHGSQPGHGGVGGRQQRPWPRLHHLPGGCSKDDWRIAVGHHFLLHVGGQLNIYIKIIRAEDHSDLNIP